MCSRFDDLEYNMSKVFTKIAILDEKLELILNTVGGGN